MRLNIQRFSVFIGQKSIFHRYCIQIVKYRIQIPVYNINNKSVNHFSQFVSVTGKRNLRKSQAQFREKLRKLRLRQNDVFLVKSVYSTACRLIFSSSKQYFLFCSTFICFMIKKDINKDLNIFL